MNIFVINSGSSSLKYQIINPDEESVLCKGQVDRIGIGPILIYKYTKDGEKKELEENIQADNHEEALKEVIKKITDPNIGVIKSLDEIHAIGHRVVHGGEVFKESVVIDDQVIEGIKACIPLGPLHNPANLAGITACFDLFPNKKQVAVFDTTFHQSMPEKAFYYGIDKDYYDKYKIRRYGFHGTSYKFITQEVAEKFPDVKKMVVCHLGNGASVCAIDNGKSIDTSMGFTPLEGLMMGTRSGDLDPAIIHFLCKNENISTDEMDSILNKKSGLGAFSKISSDMRDLWGKENEGDARAKLTINLFSYRIMKYIGSYIAALNGVDAVVFTGGIGEKAYYVRERALSGFGYLGLKLDSEKNKACEEVISADDSTVKVLVLGTNEELMIAKETENLTK
ncbi:acetate kinase [Candidatus Woesearchaeota archaeon]|nr:acetate kinase [Candidatus Woesearchaeota archaeon]